MAVHDHQNGSGRISNLRPHPKTKEILRQVQDYRNAKGHSFSMNQLLTEAVSEHFQPELKKILKTKKPTHQTAA